MSAGLFRIAVVAGISAVVVAGCGGNGGKGAPAPEPSKPPPAVDLSTLDTGKYLTLPRTLGQVASEEEGRMAEAMRMAEAVPDLARVDASLIKQNLRIPLVSPADVAQNISLTGQAVVEPVLAKHGMVTGYLAVASSQELDYSNPDAERPEGDLKEIIALLVRFPNEAAARNAAVEMDAADFAVSKENVPVPITKYPQARGHWRPTHPTMASTLAHREFVIHVVAVNPTTNLETLTGMVEKTFDAETAAIDGFQATPLDGIAKLPKDPEGLLGRLVDLTPGTVPTLSRSVATYGPNGAIGLQNEAEIKGKVYEKAGVDGIAIWFDEKQGAASLIRARDHNAAATLMDDEIAADDDIDHPVEGPRGLSDAKCFEQKPDAYRDTPSIRFFCYLTYDRYVASVASGDQADVRQRAAAQYALLVNPL